jgi:hypothetical protein
MVNTNEVQDNQLSKFIILNFNVNYLKLKLEFFFNHKQ